MTLKGRIKRLLGQPVVKIGRYTYGAEHISIHFQDANLVIGNFCSIANDVHIFLGGNHHTDWISTFPFGHTDESKTLSEPISNHPTGNGDVLIGSDVWVGAFVTIMSGVTIGDGAVIAARSHIVTDVPPFSIYGGNPARLIRMRFDQELIDALLDLSWWNLPDDEIKNCISALTSSCSIESVQKLRNLIEGSK